MLLDFFFFFLCFVMYVCISFVSFVLYLCPFGICILSAFIIVYFSTWSIDFNVFMSKCASLGFFLSLLMLCVLCMWVCH